MTSFIFFRYRHTARGSRTVGRDDWIRTSDHLHPMQMRYQAALHPEQQYLYRTAYKKKQDIFYKI